MSNMIQIEDKFFTPYISEQEIQERVNACAQWVDQLYDGEEQLPVVIPILNGAAFFAVDLLRACSTDLQIFPVKITSYKGMKRGKEIDILSSDLGFLRGRRVIIVEDIIDTGHTMNAFLKEVHSVLPKSVHLASLLLKPGTIQLDIPVDFVGFEIENDFVVGYGMDYNERGRSLQALYQHFEEE